MRQKKRFFYIPTFVIESLTTLKMLVCFNGSEKSGLSDPEKNHLAQMGGVLETRNGEMAKCYSR